MGLDLQNTLYVIKTFRLHEKKNIIVSRQKYRNITNETYFFPCLKVC